MCGERRAYTLVPDGAALETAGSQTLTATDTVNASLLGTSSSITVSAAAANHFVCPRSRRLGYRGHAGELSRSRRTTSTAAPGAGYTGTVHFTSSDTAAVLPANYTFVAGDNGVRTFTGSTP